MIFCEIHGEDKDRCLCPQIEERPIDVLMKRKVHLESELDKVKREIVRFYLSKQLPV